MTPKLKWRMKQSKLIICEVEVKYLCACTLTSRFSGLMSRCTMFIRCRYLMAPARLYTMALASRSLYLVDEVMASNRSPP